MILHNITWSASLHSGLCSCNDTFSSVGGRTCSCCFTMVTGKGIFVIGPNGAFGGGAFRIGQAL